MRYFVLGEDGSKYGPADVDTLNQWVAESRILPTQMLEVEATGGLIMASSIEGIKFQPVQQGPSSKPPDYATYPRGQAGGFYSSDDGANDITFAWVFGILSLFTCPMLTIAGIVFANKAIAKGNPGGNAVRIFNIVVLCLGFACVIGVVFFFVFVANIGSGVSIGQ